MAKRKRLSPAAMTGDTLPADLETKVQNGWVGVRPRAPIAEVSRDAAAQSAFDEVAEELRAARAEGRMVVRLPLGAIDETHLVRDRIDVDADEMTVLIDSLRDRGQQTPIEVVALEDGSYGLISGWRRLQALRTLQGQSEGPEEEFTHVQALIRAPEGAEAAYRAMVEENEIRANLSFYERARIAVKAVEQGVYPDVRMAVRALFAAAQAAKRSKILSFVILVQALDDRLRFPAAIPEKLGLTIARALQANAALAPQLREALRKSDPRDAGAERRVFERVLNAGAGSALQGKTAKVAASTSQEVAPGVTLRQERGGVMLKGAGVDAALIEALKAWLSARG